MVADPYSKAKPGATRYDSGAGKTRRVEKTGTTETSPCPAEDSFPLRWRRCLVFPMIPAHDRWYDRLATTITDFVLYSGCMVEHKQSGLK